MVKEIETLLKDHQRHHSNFQIENFIVGNSGDIWAQYKQALREIHSRYEQVINAREELIIERIKIKGLRKSLNGSAVSQIRYRRAVRKYNGMLANAKSIKRELTKLVTLATRLKAEIGNIDDERRRSLEARSWLEKARKMAGIDLLANGRITQPTMEMILALPANFRSSMLAELKSPNPHKMIGI